MKGFKNLPVELIFWCTALAALAITNPTNHHFTLCPLANLGFEEWCPGCGLGRSISYLFRGNFAQSFNQHWLGMPALGIILFRIYQLLRKKKQFIYFSQIAN